MNMQPSKSKKALNDGTDGSTGRISIGHLRNNSRVKSRQRHSNSVIGGVSDICSRNFDHSQNMLQASGTLNSQSTNNLSTKEYTHHRSVSNNMRYNGASNNYNTNSTLQDLSVSAVGHNHNKSTFLPFTTKSQNASPRRSNSQNRHQQNQSVNISDNNPAFNNTLQRQLVN